MVIDPQYAKAHDARGVALVLLKRNEEAAAAFRTAIRLDQRFAEPRFNLGKLLLESGRHSEAKQQRQTALQLNVDDLPTIELLIDSLLALNDEPSAVSHLESLHQRNIGHPAHWHLDIASALVHRRMPDEARSQYRLVLADDPTASERREAVLALSRLSKR